MPAEKLASIPTSESAPVGTMKTYCVRHIKISENNITLLN
uniref:Uncharacterized protein n=1 Tax=Methylophaga nitratireducenticrescens TaxID=754476 RepID=I1XGE5_METNJ